MIKKNNHALTAESLSKELYSSKEALFFVLNVSIY